MKVFKYVTLAVGALLLLLVIAIGLLTLFFDPNDYKDDLQRLVQEHTGRELELPGKLSLALFPNIALEFGPATLGNAPGFGAEPMLTVERVRLGVKLLPLLHKRVEVDTAEFTRPDLRLTVNAQGGDNWSDLGNKNQSATPSEGAAMPLNISVAGLKVTGGSVSYHDLQKDSRVAISELTLATDEVRLGKPIDLQSSFVLTQGESLRAAIKLHTSATLDLDNKLYRLDAPVIEVAMSGSKLPKAGLTAKLSFKELVADLKAQTLQAPEMQIETLGARLTGSLGGKSIVDAPSFGGPVSLAGVSLRELLPKLDIAVPHTSDATALSHLSFAGQLAATSSSLQIDQLKLQLDDSTVTGNAGISDLDSMALGFDLTINRLNADHYLEPAAPAAKASAASASSKSPPVAVPVELLRSLNLRGNIAVNEAVFAGIQFSKVRLGLNARGGKIHVLPSEAQLYGGQYRGDISIDAAAATPVVSFNEQVSGVDFAPLLKDWFKTSRAAGRGNFSVKAVARGKDSDAMLRTMTGSLSFRVDDGAVEGIDLWYEIRRAHALIKQQSLPERNGPERTVFSALSASGNVVNGVLTTNDISAATRALRVSGKGTIDLVQSQLDLTLNAAVQKVPDDKSAEEMSDVVGFVVPVRVTGALTDPKVRPDLEGMAKAAVKQKIDEKRQEVEQQLRDKLQDKLKGLFGN
jgi:AsmA protein